MSLFICENCGCIDNTAMNNNYWCRNMKGIWTDKRALCQECTPTTYADGTPVGIDCWGKTGVWHNYFPKRHWSEYGTEQELLKKTDIINAQEYFDKMKNKIK